MLDILQLRKDLDAVVARLEARKNPQPYLDVPRYSALEAERKQIQTATEQLQARRNAASKQIGQLKSKGEDTAPVMAQVAGIGDELKASAERLEAAGISWKIYEDMADNFGDNPLVGYGLVGGLDGTGDQTTQAPFTGQSLNAMLQQMGITVPAGAENLVIRADGTLLLDPAVGSIHKIGALAQGLPSCNGWTFWHVEREGALMLLDTLRGEIRAQMAAA